MPVRVAILGGGAWGTALAIHLAVRTRERPAVTLYMRNAEAARATIATRENHRYLPRITIPLDVAITSELHRVAADVVFVATPVAAFPAIRRALAAASLRAPLFALAKGFVPAPSGAPRHALPHEVLAHEWSAPVGVVSGPTFAMEVAQGLPTALVVASTDAAASRDAAALLAGDSLRAYTSDDLTGVEVGGAVKNVYAIAAGASDGLGFGDNARAALITRALAESTRLCVALGGRAETLAGLAGLGDLVLTCTGNQSRNRRVGLALARGQRLDAILAELGHVAEGVPGARAVREIAAHHGVDMPIVDVVSRVLDGELPLRDAVLALLARETGAEHRVQ
jgi:glycerol-3-phosphate dehydrogenase (NAD(P)+)